MKANDQGFLICPECGGKTKTKVVPGRTVLLRFPLFCPWCKREITVNYGKR